MLVTPSFETNPRIIESGLSVLILGGSIAVLKHLSSIITQICLLRSRLKGFLKGEGILGGGRSLWERIWVGGLFGRSGSMGV